MTGGRHQPLLVIWAVVVAVALSWGLGSYPLIDQDEGRNGEVAREMAASNDYALPHLNGLPYVDKPVLWFAATAGVMELLGPSELAARSISCLAALATALLVGVAGARWYGREAGWVAAIAAATAPLPLAFARVAILDSLLALLVTASVLAFHAAVEARRAGRPSGAWTVAAWIAMGLGVLTKGPVALAVPLLAAAPYAAWRRASFAVWNPLGPAVMTAIVAPWVGYMEVRLPGYLHYVAVTETWQRVASDELHRTHPWWYFGVAALAGFFPWWPFAVGRARLAPDALDPRRVLLCLWSLLPLILFSLSRSKLPQYILPLMPAVALLIASRWRTAAGPSRPAVATAVTGWLVVGTAFAAASGSSLAKRGVPVSLAAELTAAAPVMAAACLLAVAWAAWAFALDRRTHLVAALSLPLVALPMILHPALGALAEHRSERGLATLIRTELPEGTEVVGLETWRPSLAFYLRRPVPILTDDGDELRSNYISSTFERWLDPDGVLRPLPRSVSELGDCRSPRLILVHAEQPGLRQALVGAGLEAVISRPKLVAYACNGPIHAAAVPSHRGRSLPVADSAPGGRRLERTLCLSDQTCPTLCAVVPRPGGRFVVKIPRTPL